MTQPQLISGTLKSLVSEEQLIYIKIKQIEGQQYRGVNMQGFVCRSMTAPQSGMIKNFLSQFHYYGFHLSDAPGE
jgi:hypothetical protein